MTDEVAEIPFIVGIGRFSIDVAGESFYDPSFAALCGERTIEGMNLKVFAHLILEDDNPYDKQAVRVVIQGFPVGYLCRADARAFRRTVRYGPLSVYETFECAALICGGWDRGGKDVASYGVRLDLKLID